MNADNQANNRIADLYRMFIQEETRRRFQHPQLNRKQQNAFDSPLFDFHWPRPVQEIAVPGFTYQFPIEKMTQQSDGSDQSIPFAVSPNDPRFYENTDADPDQQQAALNFGRDYQTMIGGSNAERGADYELPPVGNFDRATSVNIKAPMEIHPKVSNGRRGDTSESAIINNGQYLQRSDVIKKHLDLNTVDIYVVAVIAGVSATLTVGLIAIGIAWYT